MGLTSDPKTYHNIRVSQFQDRIRTEVLLLIFLVSVAYAMLSTRRNLTFGSELTVKMRSPSLPAIPWYVSPLSRAIYYLMYRLLQVKDRFPKMAQFEGNWATREFVKGICQNARKHCRRKGINCPTLPAELLDNDGNGGGDDDGSDDGNNDGNEDGNEDGKDGNDNDNDDDDDDDGNDSGNDNGSNGVGGDGEVDEGHDVSDVRGPHKTVTTGRVGFPFNLSPIP